MIHNVAEWRQAQSREQRASLAPADCPALNTCLEREWFLDRGAESTALEICAIPREVRRDRHHQPIAKAHLESARRDQPASGRRSNERHN